jgi:feruloyl esterase
LHLLFSLAPNEIKAESIEDSAAQCETLLAADFAAIPDAPTQLTEAKLIEAGDTIPFHCHVKGYITPNVGIEMKLPTKNWNGKFLHIGCGGFCGQPQPFPVDSVRGCGSPLRKGYACIGTDMGHHGAGVIWAYNNLQAEVDFGYRATHVSTLAACRT